MKPEKKQIALDIMQQEVPALANKCDAGELTKVRDVMLKQADDQVKTNSYWRDVITTYVKYGIDEYTGYKELVKSITPEDIQNFMKEFLKSGNRFRVVMLPKE